MSRWTIPCASRIQGAGDLPYHLGRFRWLSGEAFASAQPGLERFPTDQLGIEVAEPLVLVRLVERDDVRVPEPGGNPRSRSKRSRTSRLPVGS